jgi:hypothetical protein
MILYIVKGTVGEHSRLLGLTVKNHRDLLASVLDDSIIVGSVQIARSMVSRHLADTEGALTEHTLKLTLALAYGERL